MNSTDIKLENISHLWYVYLKFHSNACIFSVKDLTEIQIGAILDA